MNRAERLKSLVGLLDLSVKHGKLPSVKELARHYKVSEPTVYMDLALLRAARLTTVTRLRRSKGCAIEEVLNAQES